MPLTALLKNGAFEWSSAAEEAFQDQKLAMTTIPFLALPDFTHPFVIKSGACGMGIGATLMQSWRPFAFPNKSLSPHHLGLSKYKKEITAIIFAVTKWQPYLVGRHFVIKTDYQSPKHFLEACATTPVQQKWLTKLLGYDYVITYKSGVENKVVDALSQQHENQPILDAITY